MPFDVQQVREQFPALRSGAVFFDNPGGTQVARQVVERITDYLVHHNANKGGAFQTSRDSDHILHETHAALADFLNARSPNEIVFGANMTTLTFHLSRSLAQRLVPGDEIIVTHLDHDANIAPWLFIAEERGAFVNWVDIRVSDCTLNMNKFEAAISGRTKIIACGYASNAVGTINDVQQIVGMARSVGAVSFIDAVQYAPHGVLDVQALDCDFLACSAYKFFGPHVGVLYGKETLLFDLPAYKVRPADNRPPYKFETGTQNHEGLAGTLGAIEYFEWLADMIGSPSKATRRAKLVAAMNALAEYERELGQYLITSLQTIPKLKIWGITEAARSGQRVPTVSFTLEGQAPREIAERLAAHNIYVWDGNYYALSIMERLNLERNGGMVRVGLAHYNTHAEVDQLVAVLRSSGA